VPVKQGTTVSRRLEQPADRRAVDASVNDAADRGVLGGRNCRLRAALFARSTAGRVADTPLGGASFDSFLVHPRGGLDGVPLALTGAPQRDN